MTDDTKGADFAACPFCGTPPSVEESSHSTACEIRCTLGACPCDVEAWGSTRREAVAAWNTRAPAPNLAALQARVAELEGERDRLLDALEEIWAVAVEEGVSDHAARGWIEVHARDATDPLPPALASTDGEGADG